jgi:hypothetical protein
MRFLSPGRVRTARRVTGSAAVLGIAAAVAGLATHSIFIDTAGPLDTRIDTGVLSLALRADGVAATRPFEGSALLAGDSVDQPLDLVNDGTAPFGSIRMSMTATSSSILDTDTANGLQLAVRSCPVPWTGSGGSWSCSGTPRSVYSGPMVATQELTGSAGLAPGGVDHLLLTAGLPEAAGGPGFQGQSSTLSLSFEGVQRDGIDR